VNRDREPEPVSYKPTCMAWVVEIFASQDKSNCKRYILRGSVCKVHGVILFMHICTIVIKQTQINSSNQLA
jgi:hypothetical protein